MIQPVCFGRDRKESCFIYGRLIIEFTVYTLDGLNFDVSISKYGCVCIYVIF